MSSTHPTDRNTKNVFEWIVFGMSCLLVATAVGVLAFQAFRHDDGPAELVVEAGNTVHKQDLTIIPIKLTNLGSTTAAEVRIEVEADFPSGRKSAELSVDFVPRGGSRDAFVVFSDKENPSAIVPRVAGYTDP